MRISAKGAACGLALAGGMYLLTKPASTRKQASRLIEATSRRFRYLGGRLQGLGYRLRGGRPDPNVIDTVLADRIRSQLGTIEKRLDLPHIHVMVEDHVALLHGEVGRDEEADELERAVAGVSGVVGVESYLHPGLTPGDTRPSEGRARQAPSSALRKLLDAAIAGGVDAETARPVVRGILAVFADRIPPGERDQVASHLPADVRPLFTPPRRAHRGGRPRTVPELVGRIAEMTGELPPDRAEQVVASVLEAFRSLVPEEVADVAAVLPPELRGFWQGAVMR